ncbi:UNVERIFIED_CONTAM: hypothetical protein Scaly_0879900 [Sesamum calycinum]|uniref:UBN2_3 domain-containing protein n=1 Tax=Sesamum calycinum TaxID=2727403 RepID=A0AAW2QW40_9LAMI
MKGRGKLDHLIEAAPKPKEPNFATWDEEDSMIMSWLWKSMQPEIGGSYMFLTTAQEIWESVCQTYAKMKDAALMYEIKTKYHLVNKGIKMKCTKEAVMLKNSIEKDRIFEFIAGLNI